MAFFNFRGGVHPYDGKELLERKACTGIFSRKRNGLSAVTAYRSPAQPVVVWQGLCSGGTEQIAEMGGFVSAPIHSSDWSEANSRRYGIM